MKKEDNTPSEIYRGSERNDYLIGVGEDLLSQGFEILEIRATLDSLNSEHCDPPLSDKELKNDILLKLLTFKNFKGLVTVENGIIKPLERKKIVAITASNLKKMEIPPIKWFIKGILPAGVCVFAAPPKYYKSFLALQLCVMLCFGLQFMMRETIQTGCLYFDLESTKRRPRDRLLKMLGEKEPPDNLYFITADDEPGTMDNGFVNILEDQFSQHPEIGLVVVDVFQRVRRKQIRTQSIYDYDYADIGEIKKVADAHNACVILVHHTRKMRDTQDVFNNMSGSSGLLGAVDVCWMLTRENRSDSESVLHITGRDVESAELSIEFNKKSFLWEYKGTADEIRAQKEMDDYLKSPVVATVKKLVSQNDGRWEGAASEIISASRYLGNIVYGDPGAVGKEIRRFEGLLLMEARIKTDYGRSSTKDRNRKYVFYCP